MSHSGVRKRLKVKWMVRSDDGGLTQHAFLMLTGGRVRDYTQCGFRLGAMHLWKKPGKEPRCTACTLAMGKGGRA